MGATHVWMHVSLRDVDGMGATDHNLTTDGNRFVFVSSSSVVHVVLYRCWWRESDT